MPILKTMVTPHGATVTFHKPGTGEINFSEGVVVVRVLSWVDQGAHDAGAGQVWSWPVSLPLSDAADVEAAMLVSGQFSGGSLVPDMSASLEARRARQWTVLKQQRESREYGGFTWDGSAFDSDPESRNRIMGAVQLAVLAAANDQPFERTWVLADNSTRVLDGNDMIAVGIALGAYVGELFDQGVALREALATSTEPETITWPQQA
ncbi:DUF4376 domain-containing protein [Aquincola tertiaricarbonis]|uniref:DUF4376 domain-containing protein n=1 Tax=Aquincola tertiaricarbonis TaxID=391953 RepID=UPI000695CF82|nr:DUF4376 domain-containing protein [Aquincola tertiaricarbonis]